MRLRRRLLAIGVTAASAATAITAILTSHHDPQGRVDGPVAAAPPGVAAILADAPEFGIRNQFICTGTLVSPQRVITAAHCIDDKPPSAAGDSHLQGNPPISAMTFKVRVGSIDRTAGGDLVTVKSHSRHHGWDWGREGGAMDDLARLELQRPTWTEPAEVAREVATPGQRVELYGWGLARNAAGEPPVILHRTEMLVLDTTACAGAEFRPSWAITENEICTGHPDGAGPCAGDSGGTLFTHIGQAVSSTSRSHGTCRKTVSANTSLPQYRPFIVEPVARRSRLAVLPRRRSRPARAPAGCHRPGTR